MVNDSSNVTLEDELGQCMKVMYRRRGIPLNKRQKEKKEKLFEMSHT